MRLSTLIRTRLEHLRNERGSRARIEARQLRKFRRLVRHAATHSPYYRETIAARGIDVEQCTPQDFPVLTKTALMANFDRIVTDRAITRARIAGFLERSKDPFELLDDRYYVLHTSGTSGEVGYFVYGLDDLTRGVTGALRVNPFGLRKRRLAFFGATDGHYTGATFAVCVRRSALRWLYDVVLCEINRPLAPTVDELNAFQPTILMGYASGLGMLADQQLEGRLRIAPEHVQSSGEAVRREDRERIERAFGVPLLNVYSCTEHLVMGLERPDYGGMYLFEDDLLFELETDHVLVTNLFNRTLPLIRYRMGDMLSARPDERRVLPFTMVELLGRNEHMPIFTNEHGEDDFVSPHTINEFLVTNVRRFQLEVEDRTRCALRVCLVPGLSAAERAAAVDDVQCRLGALLAQKAMRNVAYRVEVVDDLAVDPRTGKFRLIVPPDAERIAAAS